MGRFRDTLFVLQKSKNPQIKLFVVQELCMELCGTVEVWITMSSKTFYQKIQRQNTLQKEQKNENFWAI